MKKLIFIVIMLTLFLAIAGAQSVQQTPVLKFQLPESGRTDWYLIYNMNWVLNDHYLSGVTPLPVTISLGDGSIFGPKTLAAIQAEGYTAFKVMGCSDCQATNPCSTGGTGAIVFEINGVMNCSLATSSAVGSVTSVSSNSNIPWLTLTTSTPNSTPALVLDTLGGQTSHKFIGTGSGGVFGPQSIAADDLPSSISSDTTGNAQTATALAAAPSACPGGQSAGGVDAHGNAQNCAHIPNSAGDVNALADSGANGPVKRTGAGTSAPATAGDISALFGGGTCGTAQALLGGGACGDLSAGTVTSVAAGSSLPWLNLGISGSPTVNPTVSASAAGGQSSHKILGTGAGSAVGLITATEADMAAGTAFTDQANTFSSKQSFGNTGAAYNLAPQGSDPASPVNGDHWLNGHEKYYDGTSTRVLMNQDDPFYAGQAGTALALAALGSDCPSGQYPSGIDVNGNAINCQAATAVGLADPGANGLVWRYAVDSTEAGTSAQVASLFGTCSSADALLGDGTCGPFGTLTGVGVASVPSWLTAGYSGGSTPNLTIGVASGQTQDQVLATPDGTSGSVGLRALTKGHLPSTSVFNDQPNSYGAGQKQSFTPSSTTAPINVAGNTSDPSSLAVNDVWLNTTSVAHFKFRIDSSHTKTFMWSDDPAQSLALISTPTLCPGGQYSSGIDVNGNATGCTNATGGGTVTAFSALVPSAFTESVSSATTTPNLTIGYATGLTSNENQILGVDGTGNVGIFTLTSAFLPATTMYNNVANTMTAGNKFTATQSSTTSGFKFGGGATLDPSSLADGDMWYNTTSLNKRPKFYDGTNARGFMFSDDNFPWAQLTSVPSTFPPSAHTHSGADIVSGTVNESFLGNSAFTDQANTFAIGKKQIFQQDSTHAAFRLGNGSGTDISSGSLAEGDFFWNNGSGQHRPKVYDGTAIQAIMWLSDFTQASVLGKFTGTADGFHFLNGTGAFSNSLVTTHGGFLGFANTSDTAGDTCISKGAVGEFDFGNCSSGDQSATLKAATGQFGSGTSGTVDTGTVNMNGATPCKISGVPCTSQNALSDAANIAQLNQAQTFSQPQTFQQGVKLSGSTSGNSNLIPPAVAPNGNVTTPVAAGSLSAMVAFINTIGSTTNLGPTTLLPLAPVGMYQISAYFNTTGITCGGTAGTVGPFSYFWTDSSGVSHSAGTAGSITLSTTSGRQQLVQTFWHNDNTKDIQYSIPFTQCTGVGSNISYDVHIVLTRLQ